MHTDLWNYCLNLYARPGVERACLSLQEQGLDVCLLLCGAWLQQRGVGYNEARLQQLKACAVPWQRDVVSPLRQVRIQWREAATHDKALSALRTQIKSLELEAEQTLLRRLEVLTQGWALAQAEHCSDWLGKIAEDAQQPDCGALLELRAAIDCT